MKKIFLTALLTLFITGCGQTQQTQTPSPSSTSNFQTYRNQTYGFVFEYPNDMSFVTPNYANLEDKVVQVQTNRNLYPKTNFGDAAFSVSTVYAKNLQECLKSPVVESTGGFKNKQNINGVDFYMATSTGAGAGNFYESKTYRGLVGGQLCVELNETVHTSNIGNYEPGTVTEVPKQPLWDRLDQILKTFKLNSSGQ
jgi:hypothetical protein